jgi:Flp pilus assembly protein TadG
MNLQSHFITKIWRLVHRENGSSTVELAIVFPILLLLFVGTAELGRLFYTYTTLAKATKVGARYLSNSRDFTIPATSADVLLRTQSLVVCGYEDCTGKSPIVSGLTAPANVNVTLFTQTEGTSLVRYVRVEIQNYNYPKGIFTIAGATGSADNVFYKALTPKTTMRYMF